jgi:HTH-type transcriptional regulator/antitoxin HigA
LDNGGVFADDLSLRDLPDLETDEREAEADEFACQALRYAEIDQALGAKSDTFTIIRVAQSLGLSPAIVAGRYRYVNKNYRVFPSLVGNGEVSRCL